MLRDLLPALGGIGLFLVGMTLMRDGLDSLARGAVRGGLARFTTNPLSGAITGIVTTAMVQSSSATTVTAVGFVGAGLLTFPQALGVLFGANIGSTLTGWMIALLGFKLDLGTVAQPLLFAGALLRLFGRGTAARLGLALAGFSLLFIGVDALRAGLGAAAGLVTPDQLPADTLAGRIALVLIGLALTVVTQSSAAGVAMAMAALGAGAINLPQAAAMAIGMDIGTTATALLAAVGGSTGMRRTALAHVVYNLMTGAMAFMLLGPYARLAGAVSGADAAVALVAFHSGFNVLGVVLVLPFTSAFARLIIRLVPERSAPALRRLDPLLLDQPDAALDAAAATAADLSRIGFAGIATMAAGRPLSLPAQLLDQSVDALRDYVDQLRIGHGSPDRRGRQIALIHLIDHLSRLSRRLSDSGAAQALNEHRPLRRLGVLLARMAATAATSPANASGCTESFGRLHRLVATRHGWLRTRVIASAAQGTCAPDAALDQLDALRWFARVSYHLWRITAYLGETALSVNRVQP